MSPFSRTYACNCVFQTREEKFSEPPFENGILVSKVVELNITLILIYRYIFVKRKQKSVKDHNLS